MAKKVLFVFGIFFCFQLIISCCRNPREFIDFSEITLEVEQEESIANDSVNIFVNATDYHLVAALFDRLGFEETMAFSCEEGFKGMKFPIQSVEIISDNDFDEEHLAGTPLNDLFKHFAFDETQSTYAFRNLETEGFMNDGIADLALFTPPTLSKSHRFTLTLVKSDETIITASTKPIEWE